MASVDVVFRDRYGLHPRAAMRIQQSAAAFGSRVTIQSVAGSATPVDAGSMLALVGAGIRLNELIRISAQGGDEDQALAALRQLIEGGVCHP